MAEVDGSTGTLGTRSGGDLGMEAPERKTRRGTTPPPFDVKAFGLTNTEISDIYESAQRECETLEIGSLREIASLLEDNLQPMAHQKRAISWMLRQEKSQDARVSKTHDVQGAVLADEPGLGKTLSTLCLVLSSFSQESKKINPTLIVSPTPVICSQWLGEIQRFVKKSAFETQNSFTVTHYTGPPCPYSYEAAQTQVAQLQKSTIILTDLGAVRKEFHFLNAQASGRAKQMKYVSPLYETQWRRVIVDEVQEVESQATTAAQMLRELRTEQKWGVSGTPITKGLDALQGLAQFLSIHPFCEFDYWNMQVKAHLMDSTQREVGLRNLSQFASKHMWRTRQTDVSLRQQIHLPPVFIQPELSEFAMIYPEMSTFLSQALEELGDGWEHDTTPLSTSDLKKLIMSHEGVSSMCKAAVSVQLAVNGAKKGAKKKSPKKKRASGSATVQSSVTLALADSLVSLRSIHTRWRQRCAQGLTALLHAHLRGMVTNQPTVPTKIAKKLHVFSDTNRTQKEVSTLLVNVGSFESLVKVFAAIQTFKQINVNVTDRLFTQVCFHLSKLWGLRVWEARLGDVLISPTHGTASFVDSVGTRHEVVSLSRNNLTVQPLTPPNTATLEDLSARFRASMVLLKKLRLQTTMTCMMLTHQRLNTNSPARWIGKRAWRIIFEFLQDPITHHYEDAKERLMKETRALSLASSKTFQRVTAVTQRSLNDVPFTYKYDHILVQEAFLGKATPELQAEVKAMNPSVRSKVHVSVTDELRLKIMLHDLERALPAAPLLHTLDDQIDSACHPSSSTYKGLEGLIERASMGAHTRGSLEAYMCQNLLKLKDPTSCVDGGNIAVCMLNLLSDCVSTRCQMRRHLPKFLSAIDALEFEDPSNPLLVQTLDCPGCASWSRRMNERRQAGTQSCVVCRARRSAHKYLSFFDTCSSLGRGQRPTFFQSILEIIVPDAAKAIEPLRREAYAAFDAWQTGAQHVRQACAEHYELVTESLGQHRRSAVNEMYHQVMSTLTRPVTAKRARRLPRAGSDDSASEDEREMQEKADDEMRIRAAKKPASKQPATLFDEPQRLVLMDNQNDVTRDMEEGMRRLRHALDYVGYVERICDLAGLSVGSNVVPAAASKQLTCSLCGTADVTRGTARVLLCTHLLCSSCTVTAQFQQTNESAAAAAAAAAVAATTPIVVREAGAIRDGDRGVRDLACFPREVPSELTSSVGSQLEPLKDGEQAVELSNTPVTVGREGTVRVHASTPDSKIRNFVSRHHCKLFCDRHSGAVSLLNLSANGTFVDRAHNSSGDDLVHVTRHQFLSLRSGDAIHLVHPRDVRLSSQDRLDTSFRVTTGVGLADGGGGDHSSLLDGHRCPVEGCGRVHPYPLCETPLARTSNSLDQADDGALSELLDKDGGVRLEEAVLDRILHRRVAEVIKGVGPVFGTVQSYELVPGQLISSEGVKTKRPAEFDVSVASQEGVSKPTLAVHVLLEATSPPPASAQRPTKRRKKASVEEQGDALEDAAASNTRTITCPKELASNLRLAAVFKRSHLIKGFGSKLDAVVSSLADLKRQSPDEKALVFSQWGDALEMLQAALLVNSIRSLVLTGNGVATLKEFKTSPDITVLLMPLRATNAGLNLNEATHVYFLDTGLNPALEIQALARVRRINSLKETKVHRFIMQGTIEEAMWGAIQNQGHEVRRCDVYRMFKSLEKHYVDPSPTSKSPLSEWREKLIAQFSPSVSSQQLTSSEV